MRPPEYTISGCITAAARIAPACGRGERPGMALWRIPDRLNMHRLGSIPVVVLKPSGGSFDDLIVASQSRSEPKAQFFPIVNATTGDGTVK